MKVLKAKIRKVIGKKAKTLLKEGKIPAVLYGPGIENLNLEINEKEIEKILRERNSPIVLKVEDKEYQVLIKEIQREPIKGKIIHIDFYKPSQNDA
jgi:large subunit ribosomal protein L25